MSKPNKINAPQIVSKDVLEMLYKDSEYFSTDTDNISLNDLLKSINSELIPPLRMFESDPADLVLNIDSLSVQNPETDIRRSIPPIADIIPSFTSGTVTFPSSSGGNAVPSSGSSIVITISSGNFLKVGIFVDVNGDIVLQTGAQGASEALATNPPIVDDTYPIGFVVLQNIGGTIQNIENSRIFQYVGGGGGGGSGDSSLKLTEITGTSTVKIKKGKIRFPGGFIATGNITADAPLDLVIDLDDLNASPAATTTYWLYIDVDSLGESITFTDSGQKAFLAYNSSHFDLFESDPTEVNLLRYIPIGSIRTTAAEWDSAVVKTAAPKLHYDLGGFIPLAEKIATTHASASTKTVNHNFQANPELISLTFYDASADEFFPIDYLSYVTEITNTTVEFDFTPLTFDAGDYVDIKIYLIPNVRDNFAAATHSFRSPWFSNTSVTEVTHGLTDMDDIASYEVQEWDLTDESRRVIDPSGLVEKFDDAKFYLDWTGFSPSSNLRYRIVTGSTALPQALPISDWFTISDTYTAWNKQKIMADTTSGAFTITFPQTPAIGWEIEIIDPSDNWQTNNVTINRNGNNINGLAQNFTLDVDGDYVKFIYVSAAQGWKTY